MKKLDDLINKLKRIESGVLEVVKNTVKEYDYIILDMNTESQLFQKGIDRKGRSLASVSGGYSPITVEIKMFKHQPTDRVTLKDEGDFHRSFYIEYLTDGFVIKASDWKTDILKKNWGPDILGLTQENINEFMRDYVTPAVKEYFDKDVRL